MKQPEALRLAEWCDTFNTVTHDQTAAELRRLHAMNEELLETLRWALNSYGRMLMSPKDLETKVRDAIAKAEGK